MPNSRARLAVSVDFDIAQPEAAFIGLVDPAEDFHQRALAGAIITDQRDDFAWHQVERNIIERADAAKVFSDADSTYQRRHGRAS